MTKETMPRLDQLDKKLLRELQASARLSMAELGRRVGLSGPSVTERVQRLESAGVITGWSVSINPAALGLPLEVLARVRPGPGQLQKLTQALVDVDEVTECRRVTGEDCLMITVHTESMTHLSQVLDHLQLYGTSVTSVVVATPIPLRSLPVPD